MQVKQKSHQIVRTYKFVSYIVSQIFKNVILICFYKKLLFLLKFVSDTTKGFLKAASGHMKGVSESSCQIVSTGFQKPFHMPLAAFRNPFVIGLAAF
jgi:hypothetical protein